MYQLVVQDDVARLRYAREHAGVGVEARVPQQARRRAVEGRDLVLEVERVLRVAVQQAGAPRAEREVRVAGELGDEGGAQRGRRGQRQEVVRREVDGARG